MCRSTAAWTAGYEAGRAFGCKSRRRRRRTLVLAGLRRADKAFRELTMLHGAAPPAADVEEERAFVEGFLDALLQACDPPRSGRGRQLYAKGARKRGHRLPFAPLEDLP